MGNKPLNTLIDNRGIIFKAYDPIFKEIKTDFLIDSYGCAGIIDDLGIYEPKPLWVILRHTHWVSKNDVKLFEGDIISYFESDCINYSKEKDVDKNGDKKLYAFIEWNEIHTSFSLNRNSKFHINIGMITHEGNVFENPELVEMCFENV